MYVRMRAFIANVHLAVGSPLNFSKWFKIHTWKWAVHLSTTDTNVDQGNLLIDTEMREGFEPY